MSWTGLTTCVALGIALAGCQRKPESGGGGPGSAPSFAVQAVVVAARVQPTAESLALVGTVAANEMVEIKSESEGTVEEILFSEGQPVKQGDLLLRLDETKLAATVAEAEANFKLSRANFDRSQQLFRDQLISQQEHDQVAAQFQGNQASLDLKKRELKDARIRAPFHGVMSSRQVSPGQVISKNTTLSFLVDLDPVKIEFNVPERFVSRLQIGQKIVTSVAAYAGRSFTGEVFFIAPFLEPATRTALVKARIANEKHELKPGMFANLDLTLRLKENAILIPESAVIASGDRTSLYTLDAENTAQLRPVTLGLRQAGWVEILTGLQGNERVVAEGIQKIRPGGKVKPAPEQSPRAEPAAAEARK